MECDGTAVVRSFDTQPGSRYPINFGLIVFSLKIPAYATEYSVHEPRFCGS